MTLSLHARTTGILERYQVKIRKSLSQHFLIDEGIFHDLLHAVNPRKNDLILEVGAGLGFFTEALAEKEATVVAVEIDRSLCQTLNNRFKENPLVQVLCQNILKLDPGKYFQGKKIKAVGNLPYHISGSLLRWFLDYRNFFSEMILMVQKEVAHRLVSNAGSKNYGVLSLLCQYWTTPKLLFLVPPQAFIPPPKVESAVVQLTPLRDDSESNPIFGKLVKRSFSQRRKTLFNNLRTWDLLTPPQWKSLLLDLGIKALKRPEEIPLPAYIQLAEKLGKRTNS